MKNYVLLVIALAWPAASQIHTAEAFRPHPASPVRPVRYVFRPMRLAPEQTTAALATVATVPIWQTTDGTYSYQMIGGNPMTAAAGTTSVTTNVIPLILTFSDGTVFNPSISSACSSQAPQSLLLSSPLFASSSYTSGGVSLGNTQYLDAFQRANFWQYAGPSGVSPNYHTLLTASLLSALQVTVPAASGSTAAAACGKLGEMDINWFDSYLQNTLFPQLAALGVVPSSFPVFLLYNTVMYQGTAASCCILGYHSGFNNPSFSGAVQTYAVADFDTSGQFASTPDIASLSHELAEWMDDPTGVNPTPSWGHIGQVSGCQTNLEVADPLTGTLSPITMSNNFTYHVQELAFKSWFYHDAPSSGVNGWYSSNGTLKSPAAPCEPSVTTLSVNPVSIAAGAATTVKIVVTPGTGYIGIPTGSATLVASNNPTALATYTLDSNSSVTTTAILPAGSYSVTASFKGDLNFAASTSAAVPVTVGSVSVTLSPVSLPFASQTVGVASAAQAVTLTNTGTAPLTLSAVSFTGASPGDFSQTNNCGSSLAPAAKCTLSVAFKPTATGTRTASLSLTDNAGGSPHSVPLTGTGTAPVLPTVTLSPASLTFPSTVIGVSGAVQNATLKNTGTVSLTVTTVSVTGDFTQTNNCGSALAAAASCTVSVTFKPTVAGTRTGTLSIADNATGSPQALTLTGTGSAPAAPVVTLSPASLTFTSTVVGVSSAIQSVTLTNTGSAALSLTSVSATGDFSQTNTCGSSLAAAAKCTISVTFKPTLTGARTGNLSLADNATGSPQAVTLSGTGSAALPVVGLSATSIAFPATTSGTVSAAIPITVTNTGAASLSITSITLTGTNSGDFAQTNNCGGSLAAKVVCTLSVTFKPTAKSARSATLSLADNATGSPQTIALTGTGK